MSYGIWRKRGRGWCSMEIDTPGNIGETMADYRQDNPKGFELLTNQLDKENIYWDSWCDWHVMAFVLRHTQNGRRIEDYDFGCGEHRTWIAYDSEEALHDALKKLTNVQRERMEVLRRAGFVSDAAWNEFCQEREEATV